MIHLLDWRKTFKNKFTQNVLVVFSDDSARTVESIEGECGNNI